MELKTRIIKSTAWYFATRVSIIGLSWLVSILLARLLSPRDFGLFAMALAVIALLELLQEFGFGAAIIQRQDLTPRHLNAVFWILFSASVMIVSVAFLVSPLAARFYEEPRLVQMIRVLAASFLFDSLAVVPFNLLTKEIDFRRRSLAEASASVASAVTAVALAWHGFAFWALVTSHLVRSVVRSLMLAAACRWRPGLDMTFEGMRGVLAFGLRVAGANIVSTLSRTAQTAILGRLLGATDLGFYTMAAALGKRNPLHKISTSVLNQLSLPVFAKLQRDDSQLRRHFMKISKYLAAIAFPSQVGLALVAQDLVVLLLTEKWLPIVFLVQIFALGGILDILPLPSTPLLTARGQSRLVLNLALASALVLNAGFLLGTRWGLTGVAVAWLLAFVSLRSWLLWLSLAEVKLPVSQYLQAISPSALATLGMAAALLAVRTFVPAAPGSLERLALTVSTGVLAYVGLLFLFDTGLGGELRGIAVELLPRRRPRGADAG